ncbi:heme biosynthesis HemY N-terminal domain-containing protein [Fulvimarina sp. 2208YS6-2-32]|uniref:Heme biosynthesis HemY N-terminal domain-containing protein n=1 Tax=Fulvimarina uroteuthidis TaxID=3098149 RepID=A0ABU5I2N2_9HYPH|nr:heme biosynthesis HemY N-terminal domain-containing protein [Fulvimarina sp. 2208YS6-2-32]MDY8108426.1 heme biosynthesis HemY N-terminal domain-containing protein [Fulvimarina sp. 2208YS6-2-32]
MWGILTFFILILALYLGFGWLADNPGSATFAWQGQTVEVSMIIFLAIAVAVIVASILLVWVLVKLFRAPATASTWNRRRRNSKGHDYLTRGVLAAGAGNATLARQMIKKSEGRIGSDDRAILGFLDAQTALIEGDHERAVSIFRGMEDDPNTKLLALRGLFLEAKRVGDLSAQEYYAERALRIAPNLPWAAEAVLERKSSSRDWDGALRVLEAQRSIDMVADKEAKRLRAILLTAKAKDQADADPKSARATARSAQKLAPDFVPAALVAAQAALRLNDSRRATRYLETTWVNAPHPDIAEAYVHARAGDSAKDRLRRAEKLKGLYENHPDSDIAVARAALDAGDYDLARASALDAADKRPTESVYLLLADIEEEQSGEVGRIREWLAKAIGAPRDCVWMADGVILEDWQPISPVTHKLGAVEWKSPVEHDGTSGRPVLEARARDHGESARVIGSRQSEMNGSNGTQDGPSSASDAAPTKPKTEANAPVQSVQPKYSVAKNGANSNAVTYPSALLAIKADTNAPGAAGQR